MTSGIPHSDDTAALLLMPEPENEPLKPESEPDEPNDANEPEARLPKVNEPPKLPCHGNEPPNEPPKLPYHGNEPE